MRIVQVTPEAVPFAKTGGLADVAGALSGALAGLGHDVSVYLPLHRCVRQGPWRFEEGGSPLRIPVGAGARDVRIRAARLPGSAVAWRFVECDPLYDRDGLYAGAHGDHPDNAERFIVFARAVLEDLETPGAAPADILHAHDWQAGLVPVYVRTLYKGRPAATRARTVFTVHNIAYQGLFWHYDMPLTGLDWSHFNWREMEFHGKVNFLKSGIVFADAVTTVSERYAQEIQTPDFGCGLEGVLHHVSDRLSGIPNGIDAGVWNPETDPHLPAHFSARALRGKGVCKRHLQKRFGLPVRGDACLLAFIGRLVDQKGVDLLEAVLPGLLERDAQVVVLGTGLERHHLFLESLHRRFPGRVGLHLGFDEPLAHAIEAGADVFLMPSRYEPCGLNQLYSLRYGTVPVVRETGGLADTVTDGTPEALKAGTATGFTFHAYRPTDFREAVERALAAFGNKPVWRRLVRAGMAQDWSWPRSARRYAELYERLRASAPG